MKLGKLARFVLRKTFAQGKIGIRRREFFYKILQASRFLFWCAMSVRSTLTGFLFAAVVNVFSMTVVLAQSQLPTIDEALEMSKRSGAPILAMAGQDY